MVGYAGSPTCIVHADMTLTQSKVKVTWRWPSAPFLEPFVFILCCGTFLFISDCVLLLC